MTSQTATTTSDSIITTSFLLSNLHCPSCVSHIQETISALQPSPQSISPSLVSSWVTVKHDTRLAVATIQQALEDAGFDITDVATDSTVGSHQDSDHETPGYLDLLVERLSRGKKKASSRRVTEQQHATHVENCELCQLELNGIEDGLRLGSDSGSSSSRLLEVERKSENVVQDVDLPLVVVDSLDTPSVWRASLAIQGMTCASCTNAITRMLEQKPWVRKVAVNLIQHSAAVDFVDKTHKDEIVESIEEIGYEATLVSLVDLKEIETADANVRKVERTIQIKVDGMFCGHCPSRITQSLSQAFGSRVMILKAVTLQSPIMEIRYTPEVPRFTIRNIMAAISATDPALKPSIYHPPTLEERSRKIHQREQRRLLIRLLFALVIAVPTLIIGIIFMSFVSPRNSARKSLMKPFIAGVSRAQWILFIMATPVYFLCADVFHLRALKELRAMWRRGSPTPVLQRFYRFGSMNLLMSLGTSIAYISSIAQLIAAGVHPSLIPDDNSFYFDSVVFLTLFLLIGRLIEAYSKSKTGDAVTLLGKLRPTEALIVESKSPGDLLTGEELAEGGHQESLKLINVDLLEFGDTVRILHGASPPCDGTITAGESKFDEASLTGESKPIKKSIGDEVFSGTVNKGSPISITITGVGGSSMLDQIVQAVREGQTRRAPIERIADTLTGYFVPFVTLIAIITWIVWLTLGYSGALPRDYLEDDQSGWVGWSLQFAIAVFVVACPCGLALAAPTALFVGGGLAAQHGILVKGGGEAFEKASRLDCIVFDKTGTLTMGGEPSVTDHKMFEGDKSYEHDNDEACSQEQVLGMIMALEGNSSHTVAKAIVTFCKSQGAAEARAEDVEEIPGKGMKGTFHLDSTDKNLQILIGNEALMADNNVSFSYAADTLDAFKYAGQSVALTAIKISTSSSENSNSPWHLAAIFAISDPIRPEAPSIIRALKARGTAIWMLSGDNQTTANAIGSQLGIPICNIIAGVLPSEKADKIRYLQRALPSSHHTDTESDIENETAATGNGKRRRRRALVAMVGDGINDSPALTAADIGIAIGSGSDIAMSAASFILITSNLSSLLTLLDLSVAVFRRIKFNFVWALIYNMLALPVAAGVLYPLRLSEGGGHLRLDPVWASLAMAASSVSVVGSSLALRSRVWGVGFRGGEVKRGEERSE